MKNTNKYGFISGGYIFDLLDRKALEAINEAYPETKDQQIYTKVGSIVYKKQLCNTENIKTNTEYIFKKNDEYFVCVVLEQNDTRIADVTFTFARADHNYCEIRKKK